MGAGDSKQHFIQDAAEKYWVYKLQELAERHNRHISIDAQKKQVSFDNYCEKRGVSEGFENSTYKSNIDVVVERFFFELCEMIPDNRFDVIDVETEYRNQGKKGDFVIRLDTGKDISFSLKNYKKGFASIQLCSGTFLSFLLGFVFQKAGSPGMYLKPGSQENFRGSDKTKRITYLKKLDLENVAYVSNQLDDILTEVKETYLKAEKANNWMNISEDWKSDCERLGKRGVDLVLEALGDLNPDKIKNRILEQSGLNADNKEELLLLGKGKFLCSLFDASYSEIVSRVNSDDCVVDYSSRGKSVVFSLSDSHGHILEITVPFTLQANGAWHRPPERYSGLRYHEKEKCDLKWGDRRPKKSREIATSINTYLKIEKILKDYKLVGEQ